MTTPRRFSIYTGPPVAAALSATRDDGEDGNRSRRLNTVAERYLEVVRRHVPTLSVPEWRVICDALNGVWLSDEMAIRAVPMELADADRLNGLGAKWDVDAQALSARLASAEFAALVAVVEVAERFLSRADDQREPGDVLAECGARFPE